MKLERHGVTVALPGGWSGRLWTRAGGEVTVHAASFALPLTDDGEFGDLSTGMMPAGAAFASLTEYRVAGRLKPGSGLFAAGRMPLPLDPTAFSSRRLAHARPGQIGTQHFFSLAGRPFCVYVVLAAPAGPRRPPAGRHLRLPAVERLLSSVRVTERG